MVAAAKADRCTRPEQLTQAHVAEVLGQAQELVDASDEPNDYSEEAMDAKQAARLCERIVNLPKEGSHPALIVAARRLLGALNNADRLAELRFDRRVPCLKLACLGCKL